jgi:hypothetical protein
LPNHGLRSAKSEHFPSKESESLSGRLLRRN